MAATGRDDVLAFRRGRHVNATVFDGPPLEVPVDWGSPIITSRPSARWTLLNGTSGWYAV